MTDRLTVYDASEVSMGIGAIVINDGLPEGTFLKITSPEQFGHVRGIDGHVARFRKNDRVYLGELTLLQTSAHHTELTALLALDTSTPGGAGVVPFFLKDNGGSAIYASEFCWLTKGTDGEFGEEVKELSPWMFSFVADVKQAIPAGA